MSVAGVQLLATLPLQAANGTSFFDAATARLVVAAPPLTQPTRAAVAVVYAVTLPGGDVPAPLAVIPGFQQLSQKLHPTATLLLHLF